MATIVNDNPLVYVITNYGRSRIAEAMADTSVELALNKIKLGDGNGNYYTPSESQTSLVNEIPNSTVYIQRKDLLEDNLTVSLGFLIPETLGNCDIREVGLYETVDDVDNLFAIGTQQPIVKPSIEYNYDIAIEYYIMLKSANLAEVYDQITLDPFKISVKEEDVRAVVNSLMATQNFAKSQLSAINNVIEDNNSNSENLDYCHLRWSNINLSEIYSDMNLINSFNNVFMWYFKNGKIVNFQNGDSAVLEMYPSENQNYYGFLPYVPVTDTFTTYTFDETLKGIIYITYVSEGIKNSPKGIWTLKGTTGTEVTLQEGSNKEVIIQIKNSKGQSMTFASPENTFKGLHISTVRISGTTVTLWINGDKVSLTQSGSLTLKSSVDYNKVGLGLLDDSENLLLAPESNMCLFGVLCGQDISDSMLKALTSRIAASVDIL